MSESTYLSAVSMAEQVRQKNISALDLVDAHLARIAQLNPRLNAFIALDEDRARRDARALDTAAAHGDFRGPLHGVPLSIKSSIATAGLRCESGTRLRAGNVPATDAVLVSRLREAGAIILGVTNTPELLMAWETDNVLYGRTNNPWDFSRTPGGSSRHRGGMFGGRRRQRRRRVHPRARALQRHLRTEAHARPDSRYRALPGIRRALCFAGSGRSHGAHRRRSAATF
jgi:hypothetical protein